LNAVQENEYVQSCLLNKGKSPIVICYLPEQIKDMQRFCTFALVIGSGRRHAGSDSRTNTALQLRLQSKLYTISSCMFSFCTFCLRFV